MRITIVLVALVAAAAVAVAARADLGKKYGPGQLHG